MANEALLILLRANVAMAVVSLVVLMVRSPFRRHCGADVAYTLWLWVPIIGLAAAMMDMGAGSLSSALALFPVLNAPTILKVWLGGTIFALALLALGHLRVLRRARRGDFGPAVVGLLRPKTYLPANFSERFEAGERAVIRAHERAHILRHDAPVTYALALAQCLFWFNPLVHLGAAYMRRDQEMACDFTVMEDQPEQRALYARTMLKAQLGGHSTVFGCGWAKHPLEERVLALRETPSTTIRVWGMITLSFVAFQLFLTFAASIR